MTTVRLLRIASIIAFVFAIGHTLGGIGKWSPTDNNPVLVQMGSQKFAVMGVSRSLLDFYMGFGWCLSAAMVLQAVLLWQMARIAAGSGAAIVRPMIAAMILAGAVTSALTWRFIFPLPAVFSGVLLLVLITAWIKSEIKTG